MIVRSTLALICWICLAPGGRAQHVERYQATIAGLTTPAQLKSLDGRLRSMVSDGKWEFTEATSVLELSLHTTLSSEGLQAWVSDLGCTITAFEHLDTPTPPAARERFITHLDFPVFLDTGDPHYDGQRYESEKATWIAAHPDAYQYMTAPTPVIDIPQPE